MPLLTDFSTALAASVDAVGPSVVRVEARAHLASSGTVWTQDGVIVTAAHTIDAEDHIRVGLADGRVLPADLVGRDPSTDVAVLRMHGADVPAPRWVDANGAKAGHVTLSLARPGQAIRARLGILEAVADDWRSPSGARLERYLQIDGRLAPGFSGGPLVDAAGGVMGMNTSRLLRRAVLAVPAGTLRRVVEALITHGKIRRGYLGIGAHPVRLPAAVRQDLSQDFGVLLISVEAGSPAERAGLFLGDVIVAFGSTPARHLGDLSEPLSADSIGTSVPIRVLRAGSLRDASIVVGERQ